MAENVAQRESRYRWIGIAVVAVALIGWILAIYFWSVSSTAQRDLQRQQTMIGSAEELEVRVTTLRADSAEAEAERQGIVTALAELQQRFEVAQAEVSEMETRTHTLRDEQETLQLQITEGTSEIAEIEEELARSREQITETTQELADIRTQTQEARSEQTELQAAIADLTVERTRLTEEVTQAESFLEAARTEEAQLQEQATQARQEIEEMEGTRGELEGTIATLEQRRDTLEADTGVAEEQIEQVQQLVVELTGQMAERGEYLAELETRIAAAQQQAASPVQVETQGLVPGLRYVYNQIVASFDDDGRFHMTNLQSGEAVVGAYALEDGMLTLSEAEGDLRVAQFPMRCAVTEQAGGFTLEDRTAAARSSPARSSRWKAS